MSLTIPRGPVPMPPERPSSLSIRRSAPFWVHVLACAVVAATLALIVLGGVVTSKSVGMAVPDWPTTYGHHMFAFPFEKWRQGGVFWEHAHRVVASSVGALTLVLAGCVQATESRRWLRRLAWTAVAVVCLQGALGGYRVKLNDIPVFGISGATFFGILHATTSQIFLCLLGVVALATSPSWRRFGGPSGSTGPVRAHREVLGIVALMSVQLVVAATMRQQHAGLAIPDFPLAYGRVYPATDADTLARINQQRTSIVDDMPVTAFQIHLQMVHRILAVLLLAGVISLAARQRRAASPWSGWFRLWAILLGAQCLLGAATIWTGKLDAVATAHVGIGALSLLTGVTLGIALCRARNGRLAINPCDPTRGEIQTAAGEPIGAS
ncbi:MAG: cytochrome oxidase biogenesis protein CtaA [Verrucomicrobia bacterium]|nr:MAG: cytochrome oxidase biogenesis protein CtaA [Verrucomicrobiota bacterium]